MSPRTARTVLFAAAAPLAACATNDPARELAAEATPDANAKRGEQVTQTVTTPLSDLNLVRAPIPPILADARKQPSAPPVEDNCAGIAAQVQALDAALGTDLDAPPTRSNPGLLERGTNEVGDAAVGAMKSTVEGVVPFRGWVRRLSGAERYSREVAASIAAGAVRRAYLKGLSEARRCATPAAPLRVEASR
jgi:hypothetical protein